MKMPHFLLLILCLTLGMVQIYSSFRLHFSGVHEAKRQARRAQKELASERMRRELAEYQFALYRMEVARLIPEALEKLKKHDPTGEKTHELRGLASVTGKSLSNNLK